MSKRVIGITAAVALFGVFSPLQAQQLATGGASQSTSGIAAELGMLSDARIDLFKSALRLTADQNKYWPVVEDAIRSTSKDRQSRIQKAAERLEQIKSEGPVAALRNRNPIDFLNRRADALAERSANLKKLAAAWQPLYETLSPEQKRRLALATVYGVREMRDHILDRQLELMDEDEEE